MTKIPLNLYVILSSYPIALPVMVDLDVARTHGVTSENAVDVLHEIFY